MKDHKEKTEYQEGTAALVNKDKKTSELKASNDMDCSQVKVSCKKGKTSDLIFWDDPHFIEDILDTMVNPVSYKDKNGVFLLVNEAHARKIIGLPKKEVIGRTVLELARKFSDSPRKYIVEKRDLLEGCNEWTQIETEILSNGGARTDEEEFIVADGTTKTFILNKSALYNEEGEVVGIVTVMQDITELRQTERSLQESEERYRTAAEQTGQLVFDFRLDTHEVEWAGAIREVTGYSPEEFKNFDELLLIEHLHPEDRDKITKSLEIFFRKEARIQAEFRFRRKDGKYIYMEIRGVWLKDNEGKVYRAIGVMKDITEWKCTLEKVEASEIKYLSLIQNFQGIAFQADKNFIPKFIHGAVEEITGHTEEELISRIKWKGIILPEDLPLLLKEEERIRNSPYQKYAKADFRIRHRDGKIRWLHEIYQKVLGKDGKLKFYQGTIYDITERKETEEFLANIKTARQREIHHRIKNNLQVISSLLDLQAEKFNNRKCIKNLEVLEAFRESQNRVISIALIHEELHEGEGTEKLNFSPYLKKLIGSLFQTYRLGDSAISLKTELEENIFFDMDIAVPLGLIVNELVSNSLKHAFPDGKNGEIRLRLSRNDDYGHLKEEMGSEVKSTEFNLTVSDNGKGIPETVDFESPETLGLQLVSILVNQLEGEIELKRENGTEFIMRFNVENKL